ALETDQVNRKSKNMECSYFHRSLCCRTGICQTVRQHDTADYNTHDRPSAKPFDRTVRNTQRQESEDRTGGNINQPCNSIKCCVVFHNLQISKYTGKSG